jgi:glycosidase
VREPKVLYEVHVRQWLAGLGVARLSDVPDAVLDAFQSRGVELVWLMGVWQGGARGAELARTAEGLDASYRAALPDFRPEDVAGSPYSIAGYRVSDDFGGPDALAQLRRRLASRGMKVILDFVVNHTGLDHHWLAEQPDLYVRDEHGNVLNGKDPYFPAWTDTAQLDLTNRATRERLRSAIASIAEQCDGVRCDMAMLALRATFKSIWRERVGEMDEELWPGLILAARERNRDFLLLAEAYWGSEGELRALGFDYVYDKTLYDRLVHGDAAGLRAHLSADVGWQRRTVRFLENHDEPRAASVLPRDRHRAAALLAATLPGMLLLYEGQLEGRRVRVPIQLRRGPAESRDPELAAFYGTLLQLVRDPLLREGAWRLLDTRRAWDDNPTNTSFIAFERALDARRAWIIVNFAPHQGQCLVSVHGTQVELHDLLDDGRYSRDVSGGLFVDLPGWGGHLFAVSS